MKNLLLAIDFKDGTQKLVNFATEYAQCVKAKLWVLHVAAPEPDFVGYEVGPQYIRDMRATELKEEHRELKKISDGINFKGIQAEGLLINGGTVEMIAAEIEKLHIDAVIVGHHKHGFWHKSFFGCTDTSIIDKSKVPVIVVPIVKKVAIL